ncbi:MAG: HAMP domain-containing protein [Myxococcaceae bacterium]|nr:HAMP domain-containing protein [Myxococcaceae bacterium]
MAERPESQPEQEPGRSGLGARLGLRTQVLLLTLVVALLPIGLSGRSLVVLTRDELKSSANDELAAAATELAHEADDFFSDAWSTPLRMLRDALERDEVSGEARLALLRSVESMEDVVALRLSVEGGLQPVLVARDDFTRRLSAAGLEPSDVLGMEPSRLRGLQGPGPVQVGGPVLLPAVDTWLLTLALPLERSVAGHPLVLVAYVDLGRLQRRMAQHPLRGSGTVMLVEASGRNLLDARGVDVSEREIVRQALALLASGSRAVGVIPYERPAGGRAVAAHAFSERLPWAVIVEQDETTAHATLQAMQRSLQLWLGVGLVAVVLGATLLAQRISRPVRDMVRVARQVGEGDFGVRVQEGRGSRELVELGGSINRMVAGLAERERIKNIFGRYVTQEVVNQLLGSPRGLELVGERREVTILFTDLRGYTALSERLQPDQVLLVLNRYFEVMVEVCQRHGGTINEILGDALLVLFGAPLDMPDQARRAVGCAVEMQRAMEGVNEGLRGEGLSALEMGIGIHTGEVVAGNVGSHKRAKYTVTGSAVNLASRIESFTAGGQILVSERTLRAAGPDVEAGERMEVEAKGVKGKLILHEVLGLGGEAGLWLPRRQEELRALAEALPVAYAVLEGKHLGASVPGALVRLGPHTAELRGAAPLEPFSNLRMDLGPARGELSGQDVYAKVVRRVDEGLFLVRFTSVPPEVASFFERLRA